ncbi:RNA polymerase sigma-28 factor [Koleobacter methoxysyntrophicus]|uniref:RNA polymerase sigma factor n=1 Tax=Koleobacter methoxysyntrophicus TaxID=2751313 RepID=A0A8A0RR83_9FIRM|nr:RNA polymerase sporulation sigma factor SigK [Koleobacter methoxysyntrophicus]QSQ10029.1 RNA polymerase sigma-28 factor [Koleobacter methoxysyntrophicus]
MVPALLAALLGFGKELLVFVSYITNSTTFPEPLSSEEEEKYLKLYKEGDEEARNILIERNLRLVAHIVKKFGNTSEDTDDLISIGTIGLIKAISTFDPNKGTRLATYAARCIENEILMNLRTTKKTKIEVSLHNPIGIDKEGNEISLMDILGTDSDAVTDEIALKFQKKRLYDKIKSALKGREKKVIELRYGLLNGSGKTQREIAHILGISRSYVSRIEKRAIKKLSKELNPESCH